MATHPLKTFFFAVFKQVPVVLKNVSPFARNDPKISSPPPRIRFTGAPSSLRVSQITAAM